MSTTGTDLLLSLSYPCLVFRGNKAECLMDSMGSTFVSDGVAYVELFQRELVSYNRRSPVFATFIGTEVIHLGCQLAVLHCELLAFYDDASAKSRKCAH